MKKCRAVSTQFQKASSSTTPKSAANPEYGQIKKRINTIINTSSEGEETTMWIPRSRAEEPKRERLASTTWATRTKSSNLENPSSSIPEASLKLEPWVLRWKSFATYNRRCPPWVTDTGNGHIRTPPAISLLREAAEETEK